MTAVEARHLQDRIDGVDDFRPSAVVDREVDQQAAIVDGGVDGGVQFAAHLRRQRIQPADGLQANIVLLQVGKFLLEVEAEQPPQRLHFVPRTLPVFHAEKRRGSAP